MGLVVGPGYIAFSHLAWCGYAFTKDAVLFLQTKPFKFVYEKTSTSKILQITTFIARSLRGLIDKAVMR